MTGWLIFQSRSSVRNLVVIHLLKLPWKINFYCFDIIFILLICVVQLLVSYPTSYKNLYQYKMFIPFQVWKTDTTAGATIWKMKKYNITPFPVSRRLNLNINHIAGGLWIFKLSLSFLEVNVACSYFKQQQSP